MTWDSVDKTIPIRPNGNRKKIRFVAAVLIGLVLAPLGGCRKPPPEKPGVDVDFQSVPDGASVSIRGKEIGVTPFSKRAMPGNYLLKFSKDGFRETWEKAAIPKGPAKTINIRLEPITATVMIRTEPADAQVEIDGQVVGQTPILLRNQPIGNQKAILKKVNHVPKEISWTIRDGRPKRIDETLESNIGYLSVTTVPESATVVIDDNHRGLTPFKTELEQGNYRLALRKAGYAEHQEVVAVQKGEEKTVSANLQILPGVLRIVSQPTDAELHVNDQKHQNTPAEIRDLAPGVYKIRIEKPGFDPYLSEIDVLPGRTVDVNATLDSNTGGIDLIANPPGVTIYLNGNKIGVSEPSEDPSIANVFEIRDLSTGNHTVMLAHKRAEPPQTTIVVRVPKGGIARPEPVAMWIADTILVLKDGTRMVGRVRADNEKAQELRFEITPRIIQRYGYDEIKERVPLKYEE
jgi:NOL1/NOP2/fmu family ribosome biogenesis protein